MAVLQRAVRQPSRAVAPVIETSLLHGIDAIAADAAGALDRDRQSSMYNRLSWLRLTAEHVLPRARLIGVRARQAEDSAWLFLARQEGRRATAFADWYTLDVAPAFTAGASIVMRAQLLAAIACGLRRDFDRIDLEPVASATADAVRAAFSQVGWWAVEAEESANWIADVAGVDFDTYWQARPSRLRNTARSKLKDSGLETRVFQHFDAAAWADYEAVYTQSWKPEEGSPAFLRAVAQEEGAAGCLRLGLAYRGDRPVAGQFWTVEHGTATIHKLAYIEAEKAASPGTVLSHAMFRHVLDQDRPALIDYGNGDEAYKAEWMTQRRMTSCITLFNQRSLGGMAGAARSAAATLIRRTRHD